MNNYEWLVGRLDAFIRKYYANKVIRGTLVFLSCLLLYILSISLGEYYLFMPVWLKVTLVSLFVTLGLSSLVVWVVVPLSKMAKLGKTISHEQAAGIVGAYFPEISDKLLNILQLKKEADPNFSRELVEASIQQKIGQVSLVPITTAIDFSKNRKYLRFLLPLLLIGVFILVAAPNVFRDASARLLQPTKSFEKPAPFQFVIKTQPLLAVRNSDFVMNLEMKGNALPAEVFVELNNERVPMQPSGPHSFQYTFKNVTEAVNFRLFAAGFYSEQHTLRVAQKPVLKAFKVEIDYPAYTGRKNESRNSLGDMVVPVGTKVSWAFVADYTDNATIRFGTGSPLDLPKSASMFGSQFRFLNDTDYTFALHNKQTSFSDSFKYHVQVIPDQYPVLQVQQFKDSVTGKQVLLSGTAGDDYAITKVLFHYDISTEKGQSLANKSIPLAITPGALTTFQQYFDIGTLNLQPGQKIAYYIEAWDNDGVHGSKASRSEVMTYQMYDAKQIDSAINENSQQINSGISNSAQKNQQLQNEYKDMQSKMLESTDMDWQQKQSLQEMMKKQQDLQSQIENVKKRFEEQMQQSQQKNYSEDLKEKQQALDKQLDNLLNAELKEQMRKLQELMDKLNKDQAVQSMQQMQQDNKLFDMDMKRMEEMMKKLEMQMRMEDLANKMDDLAKKEGTLNKQTEEAKKDNATLGKDQQDIKKELDKAMTDDMKEMQKLSDDLKKSDQSLDTPKAKGKEAEQNMQQSQQQLGQNQKSKASDAQKKAQKNLEDMAQSLRNSAGGMDAQQIDIDIKATRQVLSNLIRLSFDQEDLMERVRVTSPASQTYVSNQQEQNRLHSNSVMIRDSLFELSKRVDKLSVTINKETTDLERNMKTSVDDLENRLTGDAVVREQYVMTHANNLALMLNEVLANLMQMQSQAKKAGSCSKPGGMTPKPGAGQQLADIITQQEDMGNAMQQMQKSQEGKKDGGKKDGGKQPGGKKDGGKQPGGKEGKDGKEGQNGSGQGGSGQGDESENGGEYGNAEQLARLAEQQASIRRKLQELSSKLNSKGLGNAKELRDIQQKMDKNETDLVNRRFSSEMLMRQKEITTRLLEAEKTMREQDQDDKRSSKTTGDLSRPLPPELQQYMKDRQQLLELYKTVPPQLKPYYRDMVSHYYQMIGTK